jgi:hypothetical protein
MPIIYAHIHARFRDSFGLRLIRSARRIRGRLRKCFTTDTTLNSQLYVTIGSIFPRRLCISVELSNMEEISVLA